MTAVRLPALTLAVVLADAGAASDLQVSTIVRDGRVHVSSLLTDGLVDELDGAIQSGLTTTFTYDVELRRPVSIWFDRVLATATVSASVQFDTLTGRYQLTRSVDARLDESKVSEDKAVARRFVSSFERLALFGTSDLEPNTEYYVRVRVRARPRVTWFFWPWDRGTASGIARFTFIP